MLESKGVIESVGNGTFVVSELRSPLNRSLELLLSLEEGNLRELYELRRMLEGEAAGLAAARRSDEDLATMAEAIEDMAKGLDDRDTYAAADVRFHVAVAAATGNRVALHAMHAIRDILERALEQVYGIPGSAARSLEQHRQILAAVAAGDAAEARGRMRTHLTRVEREIHDAVTTGRLADFSTPPPRRQGVAQMARIGYVGLGVMGGGVARRLLVGRPRGDRVQPHPQQGRAADRRRHALRRVAARGSRADAT